MHPAFYIPAVILSYLLGSIPFGILFSGAFGGADPRSMGSGNIGATNVSRSAGKAAGVLTLIADVLKGVLPTYIALHFNPAPLLVSAVGFGAFAGHLFPVFLRFKGGKGVATASGVMFVISPIATVLSLVVFVFALVLKRYVSLGSLLAATSLPVFLAMIPSGRDYVALGVLISILVIIKHRENIKRLATGTENRLF